MMLTSKVEWATRTDSKPFWKICTQCLFLFMCSVVSPAPLLNRVQVKAILRINSEPTFQDLLRTNQIPAPSGRYKRTHLWTSSEIYSIAESDLANRFSITTEVKVDVRIDATGK